MAEASLLNFLKILIDTVSKVVFSGSATYCTQLLKQTIIRTFQTVDENIIFQILVDKYSMLQSKSGFSAPKNGVTVECIIVRVPLWYKQQMTFFTRNSTKFAEKMTLFGPLSPLKRLPKSFGIAQ